MIIKNSDKRNYSSLGLRNPIYGITQPNSQGYATQFPGLRNPIPRVTLRSTLGYAWGAFQAHIPSSLTTDHEPLTTNH